MDMEINETIVAIFGIVTLVVVASVISSYGAGVNANMITTAVTILGALASPGAVAGIKKGGNQ